MTTKHPRDNKTGERIKTPRGTFSVTTLSVDEMREAGFSFHHASDNGEYHIMTADNTAYAVSTNEK